MGKRYSSVEEMVRDHGDDEMADWLKRNSDFRKLLISINRDVVHYLDILGFQFLDYDGSVKLKCRNGAEARILESLLAGLIDRQCPHQCAMDAISDALKSRE